MMGGKPAVQQKKLWEEQLQLRDSEKRSRKKSSSLPNVSNANAQAMKPNRQCLMRGDARKPTDTLLCYGGGSWQNEDV